MLWGIFQLNLVLALYFKADSTNFEDITQSIVEVKNYLVLLGNLFHHFDGTVLIISVVNRKHSSIAST